MAIWAGLTAYHFTKEALLNSIDLSVSKCFPSNFVTYSKAISSWKKIFWGMVFCRIMLAMFGMYWIETDWKGKSYKQKHGIVVANHSNHFLLILKQSQFFIGFWVCLWDGCILLYTFGLASAVGKKELYSLPVIGKMCQALKVIPADRYTKEGKALTIKRMEERAKNPTVPLIIFPVTSKVWSSYFSSGKFILSGTARTKKFN